MKKFITTKENPIFKEGIEFKIGPGSYDLSNFDMLGMPESFFDAVQDCDMDIWLKQGYIKEVEEKEFTKSDMIDLVKFTDGFVSIVSYEGTVNNWLKQR